jgi:hypothetical protein
MSHTTACPTSALVSNVKEHHYPIYDSPSNSVWYDNYKFIVGFAIEDNIIICCFLDNSLQFCQ